MTRVVVVTPLAGRHDHLRRQHASLAAGSRRPDAVVLASMGDDEVAGVVARGPLADVCTVVDAGSCSGVGLPIARARNLGAQTAFDLGADLLVFLDVDCMASPFLVERYVEVHSQHAGADLLCGPVHYLDPPGAEGYTAADLASSRPHPGRPAPAGSAVEEATDLTLFWSLSFAVDRPTWESIGGFDEGYRGYGGEDTDFGQRARVAEVGMWWIGGATAYHQWHPVSEPPVEHLADIVRNANRFLAIWGWAPMGGWLESFDRLGLARREPDGTWAVVPGGPGVGAGTQQA